jgi:hypothetical protein
MTPKKVVELIHRHKEDLKGLAGVEVNKSILTGISSMYCSILGMTSVTSLGLVYNSCLHLLYSTPDESIIIETFRKVATNDKYIWSGFPIPQWAGEPVNVTIGIIKSSEYTYKGSRYTDIYFRVLSGLPAGMLMHITLPSWWVIKIIKRKLGMWRTHLQLSAMDISGTSFEVKLSIKSDDKVVWDNIKTTKTQKDKNKRLINARYEQRPCGESEPCHRCPATRKQCPLAVL